MPHARAATTPLPVIEVARPCTVDWAAMTGGERSRFCAHCTREVHDLSAMRSAEVVDLVCRSAGRLCVRFERAGDGQVKTLDYEPAPSARSRWAVVVKGVLLAAVTAVGAGLVVEGLRPRRAMGMMMRPMPPPALGPGAVPAPMPAPTAAGSEATCPTP